MLDGKRCTGVRYSVAGEVRDARAGRAVVVSAGAFNSPQLLELSGIGQPERLRNLGIEVRQSLPGVGENLRDHYVPRTRWLVGKKGITFNDRGRGLGLAQQVLHYALFRQGMLAMSGAPIRAFVRSREGLERTRTRKPGAGSVPGLLTEPSTASREGIKAVGSDPLCSRDAPREQGTRSHHRGRCTPTAGDQLQFSVVAARRGADGARGPPRPRDHDRSGHDPLSDEQTRAGRRSDHR